MNAYKIFQKNGVSLLLNDITGEYLEIRPEGDFCFYPNGIVRLGNTYYYKQKKLFSFLYPVNKYRLEQFYEAHPNEQYRALSGPNGDTNKFLIGENLFKFEWNIPQLMEKNIYELSDDAMVLMVGSDAYSYNKKDSNYYQTSIYATLLGRALPEELVPVSHIITNEPYVFEVSHGEFPHFVGKSFKVVEYYGTELLTYDEKIGDDEFCSAVMQAAGDNWEYIGCGDTLNFMENEIIISSHIDEDEEVIIFRFDEEENKFILLEE